MLTDKLEKEPTKREMADKVNAWKTINSILVKTNSEFMQSLNRMLVENKVKHEELKNKLEKGEGTEDDNAEYIFVGGYIKCLEDILHARKA